MNMELSQVLSHWDGIDIVKIICSIIAGNILGVEREFKDKSAGLKTITVICLGSTLFTILSFKMGAGDSEDATRIASYVVSGIGFLGAGVIFKDGNTVSGLTTASIIWMAAAIGMSLGFGEFVLAFIFLMGSMLVVYLGNLINRLVFDKRVAKLLYIELAESEYEMYETIYNDISVYCKRIKEKSFHKQDDKIKITYDIFIEKNELQKLKHYLCQNKILKGFEV